MNGKKIVTAGVATLVAGWGLQQLYKATNYYPPQPVFWFATGAVGSVLLGFAGNKSRALTG